MTACTFKLEGWSSLPLTIAVTGFPTDNIVLGGKFIFVFSVHLGGRVVETANEEEEEKG